MPFFRICTVAVSDSFRLFETGVRIELTIQDKDAESPGSLSTDLAVQTKVAHSKPYRMARALLYPDRK